MSGFKGYPPLTRSAKKLAMSTTPIPIDKVLAGPAPVEHETRVLVLRGCEFFDDLTSAELNTLAGFVELRAFRAGERVFLKGDSATWNGFRRRRQIFNHHSRHEPATNPGHAGVQEPYFGRDGLARRRKPLGDMHDRLCRKIGCHVRGRIRTYVAHGARTGAEDPARHRKAGQSTASSRQWHGRRRGELKSKRARIVHHPHSTTAE